MNNLRTFYGKPVSDHADRSLDLVGIGKLMALSWRPSLNALACVRYRPEFGGGSVFAVRRDNTALDKESEPVAFDVRGAFLFTEAMTLEKLIELITAGHEIKVTRLSEDFEFADLLKKNQPG